MGARLSRVAPEVCVAVGPWVGKAFEPIVQARRYAMNGRPRRRHGYGPPAGTTVWVCAICAWVCPCLIRKVLRSRATSEKREVGLLMVCGRMVAPIQVLSPANPRTRSQMIYFLLVTSALAVANGATLHIMGNTPMNDFVDDGAELTLIHNATEYKALYNCSTNCFNS